MHRSINQTDADPMMDYMFNSIVCGLCVNNNNIVLVNRIVRIKKKKIEKIEGENQGMIDIN